MPSVMLTAGRPAGRVAEGARIEPVGERDLIDEEPGRRRLATGSGMEPHAFGGSGQTTREPERDVNLGGGTPAAAQIRSMRTRTGSGSPFVTTKLRPASLPDGTSCSRATARASAALVTYVVSISAVPPPTRNSRPDRARSTIRPISCVSPGPQTAWGRIAVTAMARWSAASAAVRPRPSIPNTRSGRSSP